jgi:hypothetical protein
LQKLDGRFPKAEMLEEACEITTLDLSEDHLFQFLADNNLPNSLSEYYDDVLQDPSNLIAESSCESEPNPAIANSLSEPLVYSGRSTPSRLNMNEPASTSERHDSENDSAKNHISVIHVSWIAIEYYCELLLFYHYFSNSRKVCRHSMEGLQKQNCWKRLVN